MVPSVLQQIAEVLPQFRGADLESQLQTFDIFLGMLPAGARPVIAGMLREAAGRTEDAVSRARIAEAAMAVAMGERAAAPYDHEAAMREYRAQHAANFAAAQVEGMVGRKVSEVEFREWVARTGVRQADAAHWVDAATGRVVAWKVVGSLGGEEDFDYYVASVGSPG
jgi:hypothetical protein